MPLYRASQPTSAVPNGFKDVHHLLHTLYRAGRHQRLYDEHFRDRAGRWLDGSEKPLHNVSHRALHLIHTEHPRVLANDVLHEMRQHHRGKKTGGGLSEAFQSLWRGTLNHLGWPKLRDWLGLGGAKKKKISQEGGIYAALINESYQKISDRQASRYGLTRIEKYDSDRVSVWRETNGDLFIAVKGTASAADLGTDMGILAGGTARSKELEDLVTELLAEGNRVDIGGHSLATQFITNMPSNLLQQIDETYLYNPASSPFESNAYLNKVLGMENTYWFVNESDLVSSGLFNLMSNEFIEKHVYLGGYRWSPLAAHALTQWYRYDEEEEMTANNLVTNADARKNPKKVEQSHLQALAKIQALAEKKAKEDEAAAYRLAEEEAAQFSTQAAVDDANRFQPDGVLVV